MPEHPSIVPASALGLSELAALFTAGYEDYYTPIRIDRVGLEFMVGAWDIDLDASRVAFVEDSGAGSCYSGFEALKAGSAASASSPLCAAAASARR